jgi:heme/copper-type cytochrome/quinol oxidase subunit 2
MGVKLVIFVAGAAIISLVTYRRAERTDADRLNTNVQNLRQATSVVLAIGNAIWAVIDALQLLFRPSRFGSGGSRMIGQRASEVIIDET